MAASTLSVRSSLCRAQRIAPAARPAGPRAPFLGRPQRLPVRKVRNHLQKLRWETVLRGERLNRVGGASWMEAHI